MLLHSNVITRIQIVSKVLSRDLLNTKLKFLVPLSIHCFMNWKEKFITYAFLNACMFVTSKGYDNMHHVARKAVLMVYNLALDSNVSQRQ